MNLAVITSGFLPVPAVKGGAVENLIVNLIDENEINKNIKFTIFSIFDQQAQVESKKYQNTEFIFIKTNGVIKILDKLIFFLAKNILRKKNSQSYRFILQRIDFLNKISKNIKQHDYDKILLENHPTQYLALKWKKNYIKYKDRYYYHCHNEFVGTYGCKHIIKNTKKILCVSEFIMNSVINNLGIDKKNCVVLKNGIDSDLFSKKICETDKNIIRKSYNLNKEDNILLFTGRLIPEKGIKELIEATQYTNEKNYKLLIVGSSLNNIKIKTKYEEELRKQIIKTNDKIIFTGFVNYSEIYKFYNIADLAIIPSMWDDPAPLTVIEAMTAGLPIITTNSGGIPEYANPKCAEILKRDKYFVRNLSKAIDRLLKNKKKRKKMSRESILASCKLTREMFYKNFVEEVL